MKFVFVILALILLSCGGSLSSEQRKKMRENMKAGSLRKVTDAELTEAALGYGRKIAAIAESHLNDRKFLDSLGKVYDAEILFLVPGDAKLRSVERQIVEAYASSDGANSSDNIQKMGNDSLLYSKPLGQERPDGSIEFTKTLGLRLHTKPIILSIKD